MSKRRVQDNNQRKRGRADFFIQYIIGDAEGHDDLAAHFRKNENHGCLYLKEWLSSFLPGRCIPLTMKKILDTRGNQVPFTPFANPIVHRMLFIAFLLLIV